MNIALFSPDDNLAIALAPDLDHIATVQDGFFAVTTRIGNRYQELARHDLDTPPGAVIATADRMRRNYPDRQVRAFCLGVEVKATVRTVA